MKIYTLLLFCFFTTPIWSQILNNKELFVIDSMVNSFTFKLDISQGKLDLNKDFSLKPTGKYPGIKAIELQNADLIVDYDYQGKSNKFSEGIIEIVSITTEVDSTKLAYQLNQFSRKNTDDKTTGSRIWMDAMENVLETELEYEMTIKRRYYDIVDLSQEEPNFQKSWIPVVIAGVGATALGLGQIFKNQQEDAYKNYQQLWRNGNPESDAQGFYEEADKHHKWSKRLHGIGWVILATDAVVTGWWIKKVRYKRKLYRRYKKLSNWQIEPFMDYQPLKNQPWTAAFGAHVQLQF